MSLHPLGRGLAACVLCLALLSDAFAGQLLRKTFSAQPYAGSQTRQYQVFVPDGYTGDAAVPMVMVLHGCNQTEQNMIDETGFTALAERDNFIAVFPFITRYDGLRQTNCWGFWFDGHIHEGAGEAEDLYRIGLEVEAQFRIDPERRYVTGLSSGGAMAVVMAVAQSEYFAAAGAAAGLPYSETPSSVARSCSFAGTFRPVPAVVSAMTAEQDEAAEQRVVPFMTVHSNRDCTVNRIASENIRDAWLQRYGAGATPQETLNCTAEGVPCVHRKYGTAARSVVETVFYDGTPGDFAGQGSHYWVGDNPGTYANPTGPSASALFWDFFQRHSLSGNRPPQIAIAGASAAGTAVHVSGTAQDEDGTVAQVSVRLDGLRPQAARVAAGTTSWSVTFDPVPDDTLYIPVATATDDGGASSSVTGTPVAVGSPPPNQPPSLTLGRVEVDNDCVTVAGTAADADGTVVQVEVALGTRGFRPAQFAAGEYSYRECDLPAGAYTTEARATDDGGAVTVVTGPGATVSPVEAVVANWQAHMQAGRLRVYLAPCPSVGFGACDMPFHSIYLTHGEAAFPLYKDAGSEDWYYNRGNVPPR